jgi:hypothetical protein
MKHCYSNIYLPCKYNQYNYYRNNPIQIMIDIICYITTFNYCTCSIVHSKSFSPSITVITIRITAWSVQFCFTMPLRMLHHITFLFLGLFRLMYILLKIRPTTIFADHNHTYNHKQHIFGTSNNIQ